MAKMMKLTDGGKALVDSVGRAKEGKCCCPSTLDCTACNAAGVAATTAIVTLSGINPPIVGGSTICGVTCSTFNGTYYVPFFTSTAVGTNYVCEWRITFPITCNLTGFTFSIVYDSSGNITQAQVVRVPVGTVPNFLWILNINGRADCHRQFTLPFAGAAPSTNWWCDSNSSTCTVTLS